MSTIAWLQLGIAFLTIVIIPLAALQIRQYIDIQALKRDRDDMRHDFDKEKTINSRSGERLTRIETMLEMIVKKLDK